MNEQSQLVKIAAALKGDNSSTPKIAADERSMSMAREVMNIIGRENKKPNE